jgi:Ferritin-like domain
MTENNLQGNLQGVSLASGVQEEDQALSSRRKFLTGSAALLAGGALAAVLPGVAQAHTTGNPPTDVDVLNYALTLEHLEYAFYRDGLDQFSAEDFTAAGYADNVYTWFGMIRDHEKAHVETIAKVIEDLGGEPVAEAAYDFGYADLAGFVAVAQVLENTGVSAYQGAAKFLIGENELLTAALTIHGIEARHAAYLNGLQGQSPFPEAFNPTLTPEEVLEAAGSFIVAE